MENTQYYCYLNGQQLGPMPLEALRAINIKRETLVWHVGMENWSSAGTLPELSALFAANSPKPPQISSATDAPQKRKTFAKTAKVFSIFGIICAAIMQILSIVMMTEPDRTWSLYGDYYSYGVDSGWSIYYFALSLFLLVISIITCAKSGMDAARR